MTDNNYEPLRDHLKAQARAEVILTFEEIENILGFALPRSAYRAEWWGDDTPEHPRLQRQAIRDGGYDAQRMPDGQSVRFSKPAPPRWRR
jgi:hypothetical protein